MQKERKGTQYEGIEGNTGNKRHRTNMEIHQQRKRKKEKRIE